MQVAIPGNRWSSPHKVETFDFHANDKTTYSKFHCNLNQVSKWERKYLGNNF